MTKVKSKNQVIWLSISLCQNIYETFRKNFHEQGLEPLPNFNTRYPNLLESILESVKLKAKLKNFSIPQAAASYFVHLVRSQAHLNGNKRMGVLYTFVFLYLNGYTFTFTEGELQELSLMIASDSSTPISEIETEVQNLFQKAVFKNSK